MVALVFFYTNPSVQHSSMAKYAAKVLQKMTLRKRLDFYH